MTLSAATVPAAKRNGGNEKARTPAVGILALSFVV